MREVYKLTSIKFPQRGERIVSLDTFTQLKDSGRLRNFRWEKVKIKEAPIPEELKKRLEAIEVEEVNEEATTKRKNKKEE